jgi:hypothetical protein
MYQSKGDYQYSIFILITIHDCLKILKTLALHRPTEATCFSLDNLLFKDGQVRLSDVYLNKAKVKKEILILRNKNHSKLTADLEDIVPESYTQKLWQLQNLQFICCLACMMITNF